MKRSIMMLAALALVAGWATRDSVAAGTSAGTVISNKATVVYTMSGSNYSQDTNVSTLTVDDKVSFTLTASDPANVTIFPNGKAYLTYVVTNTGNGPHDFTLNAVVTGTPTFTPAAGPAFYSDAAGTTALPTDPNAGGLPYINNLAQDGAKTVYLFVTAPPASADGQTIDYVVTAEAYQPNNLGAAGPVKSSAKAAVDSAVNKNANLMTQFVVLADGHGNGGDANRDGKYAVIAKDGSGNTVGFIARSATLNVIKAETVTDQFGGSRPMSGSTIHYTLTATAGGTGTAMGVVITDPIPANTTYTTGTLKLNGAGLSDIAGDDAGDVGGTTPGTVTVSLGNLTSASSAQTITFDVKIN
jgi:uncharacterized repeat protein (TIGR01451 family)